MAQRRSEEAFLLEADAPQQARVGPTAARRRIAIAFAGAAALTAVVALVPFLRFAYRLPTLHAAVETADALIGAAVAFLFYGRFRRTGLLADAAVVYAFLLLAATNLLFSAGPTAIVGARSALWSWAAAGSRLAAVAALAMAAFVPARRLAIRHAARVIAAAVVATLVAAATFVAALRGVLPPVVEPGITPDIAGGPLVAIGHPVIVGLQGVAALVYAAAAVGFLRKAENSGDDLMGWLAAASVIGSFARVHYLLFPSLYSEWFYSGDLLRLASYATLLVGAAFEVRSHWESSMVAAVDAERQRLARDLHDGLIQELSFIRRHALFLASAHPAMDLDAQRLASAAERALDDSRRAVVALTEDPVESLDVALARAAATVADRWGLDLRLDLQPDIRLSPATREALTGIVQEAVNNAGRHGGAERVDIRVRAGHELSVIVADDGSGFDVSSATPGFGLETMQRRAAEAGGRLRVASKPGEGTEVEVTVPWPNPSAS